RSVRECFAVPVRIEDLIPRQPLRQRPAQRTRKVVLLESHLHDRIEIRAHVTNADVDRYVLILAVPHAAIRTTSAFHFIRTVHINVAWLGGATALAGLPRDAILVGIRGRVAQNVSSGCTTGIDQRLHPAVRPRRLYFPIDVPKIAGRTPASVRTACRPCPGTRSPDPEWRRTTRKSRSCPNRAIVGADCQAVRIGRAQAARTDPRDVDSSAPPQERNSARLRDRVLQGRVVPDRTWIGRRAIPCRDHRRR